MNTFQINDITLRYNRTFFNEAYRNERSLEVAIGHWFLDRFNLMESMVLEVGAVMPYYLKDTKHEVIDLADEHPKSRKINALDYDYAGRNVLSISTIEHMMKKEYNNGSDNDGITFLTKVLTSAPNYLITMPTGGYNPHLEAYLTSHPEIPRLIMRRTNWKNEWIKHDNPNDFAIPFGHSDRPIPAGFFNNANAVIVITNLKELL
jgi:hypothetical protein